MTAGKIGFMTLNPTGSTMHEILFVRAKWDAGASVWVATADDVPGLVTESDTLEALSAKLGKPMPELLDANGCLDSDGISFGLLARNFSWRSVPIADGWQPSRSTSKSKGAGSA
jgi:hypothetical protein